MHIIRYPIVRITCSLASDVCGECLVQAEEDPHIQKRLSTKQLLMENIDHAINIYLIYVLSLSIFPGFLSEDTGSHSLGSW
jgi:solute carrier family 29 (equilibrative nucleoside transporter), member 1/2/3